MSFRSDFASLLSAKVISFLILTTLLFCRPQYTYGQDEDLEDARIPAGKDAKTVHDFAKTAIPILEKWIIDDYHEHGQKDPGKVENADIFLRAWIRNLINHPEGGPEEDTAVKAYKACEQRGAGDPLLYGLRLSYFQKMSMEGVGEWGINYTLEESAKRDYSPLVQVVLAGECAHYMASYRYGRKLKPKWDKAFFDNAEIVLTTEQPSQDYYRPLFLIFAHAQKSLRAPELERLDALYQKLQEESKGDPWLLHSLRGDAAQQCAREYARRRAPVTQPGESAKKYRENQTLAATELRKAHALRPDRPDAAARLIKVSGARHDVELGTPTYWFNQAVKAEMDCAHAYESFLTYMRIQLNATVDEQGMFADRCMQTQRYDTFVPMVCYDVICKLTNQEDARFHFWKHPAAFATMDKLIGSYVESEAFEKQRDWIMSRNVAMAWRCGRYAEGLKYLKRFDDYGRFHHCEALKVLVDEVDMFNELHARGGLAGNEIDNACEALRKNELSKAKNIFASALKKVADDPYATQYVKNRLAGIELQEQLTGGEWVDIAFDEGLTGWWRIGGDWNRLAEDTVGGHVGRGEQTMSLYHFANVGHRFQYEADVSISARIPQCEAAILFARTMDPIYRFRSFSINPDRRTAGLMRAYLDRYHYPTDIIN